MRNEGARRRPWCYRVFSNTPFVIWMRVNTVRANDRSTACLAVRGGWLRGEYCNLARVINPRVNKWRDQWGRLVRPAQSGEADAVMTCNLCYSDQPGFFSVTSNSVPPTRAHTPASDPSRRCISDTLAGVRVYIWKAISSLQLDGTFAH